MFNKKSRAAKVADWVAPPKKSYKGRVALAAGLIGIGAAFIASGFKGSDAR